MEPGPDSSALADAFGLGSPPGPVERIATGWGGHNVVWRLTTDDGHWAIKQVGRDAGADPDAAMAIEMAAYANGVPMPRPIPTADGTCFATIGGQRFRCHAWIDGIALGWHGHTPDVGAQVGALLAGIHRLALPWSPTLGPTIPVVAAGHWALLAQRAGAARCHWSETLIRTLPTIDLLEAMLPRASNFETAIGSHRDLHPPNLLRLAAGGFALIDWDAAGPVIPAQEVACFALVFGDRGDGRGYDEAVVAAFVDGYRQAGGQFTFRGVADLAMQASGLLWWTAQNVQLALASPMDAEQARLTRMLIENLGGLDERLSTMATLLAGCVG